MPRSSLGEIVGRASGGKFDKPTLEEEKTEANKNHLYEGEDFDCSICLFEKMKIVLPCMHAFCENCITDWLSKQKQCPMCRSSIHDGLNMLSGRKSVNNNSFFELIDIEGEDNVLPDLEKKVEYLVNSSIEYLLNMPEFDLAANLTESNPFIKVDIEKYQYY